MRCWDAAEMLGPCMMAQPCQRMGRARAARRACWRALCITVANAVAVCSACSAAKSCITQCAYACMWQHVTACQWQARIQWPVIVCRALAHCSPPPLPKHTHTPLGATTVTVAPVPNWTTHAGPPCMRMRSASTHPAHNARGCSSSTIQHTSRAALYKWTCVPRLTRAR